MRIRAGGRRRSSWGAWAVAAVAAVGLSACGGTNNSALAARARQEAAAPAATIGAHVWFAGHEDGELGVYLRPDTTWPDDRYVDSLAATAQIALDMARRHTDVGDVEVCQDAVWLPHDKAHPFVPGTRVTVHRSKLGQLPARLTTATDVLRAVSTGAVELIIDPRLVQTDAYRRAVAATAPDG